MVLSENRNKSKVALSIQSNPITTPENAPVAPQIIQLLLFFSQGKNPISRSEY